MKGIINMKISSNEFTKWISKNASALLLFVGLMLIWIGRIFILDWCFSSNQEFVFPTLHSIGCISAIFILFFIGTFLLNHDVLRKIITRCSLALFAVYLIMIAVSYGRVDENGITYRSPENFFLKKIIPWSQIHKNPLISIRQSRKSKIYRYTFDVYSDQEEFDLFVNLTCFRKDRLVELLKLMKDNDINVSVTTTSEVKKSYPSSDEAAFINQILQNTNSAL
jgi:multisubunit Na+/H+ antiporter MnhC subunit